MGSAPMDRVEVLKPGEGEGVARSTAVAGSASPSRGRFMCWVLCRMLRHNCRCSRVHATRLEPCCIPDLCCCGLRDLLQCFVRRCVCYTAAVSRMASRRCLSQKHRVHWQAHSAVVQQL